jgi:integrating conjugative element protein (TIGR03761 family)
MTQDHTPTPAHSVDAITATPAEAAQSAANTESVPPVRKPRVRRVATPDTTLITAAEQTPASKAALRRPTRINFYRSKTSLFADGYDIERERLEVLGVIKRNEEGETIASSDPLFDRWMMFLDRSKELKRLTAQRQKIAEAPSQVSREEVKAYRALGGLVNAAEAEDTITLHTKEAFQLFIGRAADPDNPTAAKIISFKKAGAAYRLLWNLSTNNNPYADWALIDLSNRRQMLQDELAKSVVSMEETLERMRQTRGMNYVVAQNPTPQALPIRFKSPYGYAMVDCLAEFDYLVRLIRTLVFKARLTSTLADQLIRDHMRMFRAHFNEVKRFERYLGDADLLLLTRNDFLPTSDDVARARVSKCIETFGQVPKSIFNLDVIPPFKSHRGDLSDQEKELLKRVTSGVYDDDEQMEAHRQEAGAAGLI